MNSTFFVKGAPINGGAGLHCSKDALTDMFGWFLQVLLASLAFTCLILKRFCEPQSYRRSWQIWCFDTSKQGLGALFIHLSNVWLAGRYKGDPCTWYLINFLLDSSMGLFIIFVGIKLCQLVARTKNCSALNFGEYGKPPQVTIWLFQCTLYVLLMVIVKLSITLFMQMDFWDNVKNFILSPINNPRVELAFVMLIIPFFINILMFWVTDNFLMYRDPLKNRRESCEISLLEEAKKSFKYRNLKPKKKTKNNNNNNNNSESEILLSDDELLLEPEQEVPFRIIKKNFISA